MASIAARAFSQLGIKQSGARMEPGFRLTQDLDFLKDREGEKEIPVIYDDGDMWELSAKQVKALLDVKAVYHRSPRPGLEPPRKRQSLDIRELLYVSPYPHSTSKTNRKMHVLLS